MSTKIRAGIAAAAVAAAVTACASLGNLLQPPNISAAQNARAELRLLGPSLQRPLGGASVRLYARVQNPNAFGLTLGNVAGNLFLEDTRAADVSLPIGLPLAAQQDTVIPLDISLSFSDLPGLAEAAKRILLKQSVDYRLDGTFSVDAGALGQPTFGPQTLLRGALDIRR
jgi:hypothetical protein